MDVVSLIILLSSLLVFSIFNEGSAVSVHGGSRRCPTLTIRKGKAKLRSRGRLARVTCFSGYELLGEKFVLCEEGKWLEPLPMCIRNGCPSMKTLVPNSLVSETYSGALVEVACVEGYTLVGASVLACNGIHWNDTIPSCYINEDKMHMLCDFESNDTCGWRDDTVDNFNWQRHSMATSSGHIGTGPEFDHTLGASLNGHYLYIEASNRNVGDVARFISPRYPPSSKNTCFTFWYHMYGGHIGSLNVYVGQDLAFGESGNHGNRWIKAFIPVNHSSSPFYITIDGIRGNGYAGDIAIDDLKLSEGSDCEEKNEADVILSGSCIGRCYDNLTTDINSCYCHEECHVNNTCCFDFLMACSTGSQASYFRESTNIIGPSLITGVILSLLTLSVIIIIIVCLIRRRRLNQNDNDIEDSDVQFLTSDEIINFNWARPSPDRQDRQPVSKQPRTQKVVPQDCIRLMEQ